MRFYEWASSSEDNSIVWHLHIRNWRNDFELSWRLQEAQPLGEGEWIQEAPAEWDEEGPLTDMPFNPNFTSIWFRPGCGRCWRSWGWGRRSSSCRCGW
jgi:hypothetical protein